MATSSKVESNTMNYYSIYDFNDKSWQVSTWTHRACFACGCATLLISLAKCISLTPTAPRPWFHLALAAFSGYLFADLGTGIYHWAIDNYGCPQTPIFGSQIEAFQRHHNQPWAITKQHLARNLHLLSAGTAVAVMPVNVLSGDPVLLGFLCVFAGCGMFCQLFHAWAHTPKGNLPPLAVALQDAGVVVGRGDHMAHHRPPYSSNYCIVSGVWNRFLDWSRFFLVLEFVIFKLVGVEPRSWSEPTSD